jgi:hypothetical protein
LNPESRDRQLSPVLYNDRLKKGEKPRKAQEKLQEKAPSSSQKIQKRSKKIGILHVIPNDSVAT